MGIRFCSCRQAYCKDNVQCYEDLPGSVGIHHAKYKDSPFSAFKIVSTMNEPETKMKHSRSADNVAQIGRKHKHKKRKKSDSKKRKLVAKVSYSSSSGSSDFRPRAATDELLDRKRMRPYILYKEGLAKQSDGTPHSVHYITSEMMLEMDIEGHSAILTQPFRLNHILSRVPPRYQWMRWRETYSLLNDGSSMSTLFARTKGVEQSMMIIQDQSDHVFGAFLDCPIDENRRHYGGSADCFVFRFESGKRDYSIFEYHNTMHYDQPYYLRCTFDGITVGAGECPAIYIEHDLLMGTTKRCDTFCSEPLSPRNVFQIKNLEIWYPSFE